MAGVIIPMAGNGFKWRDHADVLADVRQRYEEQGQSAPEIAAALGLGRYQIEYAIRQYGLKAGSAERWCPKAPVWTAPAPPEERLPPPPLVTSAPTRQDVETSVFLSDVHIPSQDAEAVRVVLNFILWLKPTHVFLTGDIFDCYALSRFDKAPRRIIGLQSELDQLEDFLFHTRLAAGPDAEIHYMEGNHERRVQTYLTRHPELSELRGLKPENLFRLNDYGIQWHPQEEVYRHHGFIVTHGTVVRKHAGRSAQGEFEKYISSGISGHTHRAGSYTKTAMDSTYAWYELGCLCDLEPEYMVGTADWQHAIAVGHFIKGDNRFAIEQVQIPKRKLLYRGLLFD